MAKRIWKYQIKAAGQTQLQIPAGGEILTAKIQDGAPCVWVLLDDNKLTQSRYIQVFETDEPIPVDIGIDRKYIATCLDADGEYVFHVFEYTGI